MNRQSKAARSENPFRSAESKGVSPNWPRWDRVGTGNGQARLFSTSVWVRSEWSSEVVILRPRPASSMPPWSTGIRQFRSAHLLDAPRSHGAMLDSRSPRAGHDSRRHDARQRVWISVDQVGDTHPAQCLAPPHGPRPRAQFRCRIRRARLDSSGPACHGSATRPPSECRRGVWHPATGGLPPAPFHPIYWPPLANRTPLRLFVLQQFHKTIARFFALEVDHATSRSRCCENRAPRGENSSAFTSVSIVAL